MKTLVKTYDLLIYGDETYKTAVNYTQSLYNDPITLNYEGVKYILDAGTSDNLTILQDGIFIYVISENRGLQYIGLQVFNTELKQEEGSVFLGENDISEYGEECTATGILDKDIDEQIKILFQYL